MYTGNAVYALPGFSPERFQGDRPCLAVLDLKDNAIDHWELLAPLVHCEVYFNVIISCPIKLNAKVYYGHLMVLQALRELHLQLDSAVENNECIGSYANPVCDAPAYRTTIQQVSTLCICCDYVCRMCDVLPINLILRFGYLRRVFHNCFCWTVDF